MEHIKDIQISVAHKCIRCGRCIAVCPSDVFGKDNETGLIEVKQKQRCISCGQCVAICPTSSIHHSYFQQKDIHPYKIEDCPNSEQFLLLCKKRRSNRAFSSNPIPLDVLKKIIEAGYYAPTAHNSQNVKFTLITSQTVLQQLVDFTIKKYKEIVERLTHPAIMRFIRLLKSNYISYIPMMQRVIQEYENGNDLILRNATAVILIHADENDYFSSTNANLAYQNASLMAETLHISQFYMGFLCSAINLDKRRKFTKKLGIQDKIYAAMALGIPKFEFSHYINKKNCEFDAL